jgi:hypothetical protein
MCQGAIVSLYIWRDGKKTRREVRSGIGSHSDLARDSREWLISKGWTEDAPGQNVISIESNFKKGWNVFTIESGKPSMSERAILSREYKRIAGDARALIAHVKKCGKVDDGLIKLLYAPAQKVFDETCAQARKVFNETCAPAQKVLNETCAPAQKVFDETCAPAQKVFDETYAPARKVFDETYAPARKVFDETYAPARKVFDETCAPAQKVFDETCAPAQKVLNETCAPAQKVFNETYAPARKVFNETCALARKVFNETCAPAWIKLFKLSTNRVKHLQ